MNQAGHEKSHAWNRASSLDGGRGQRVFLFKKIIHFLKIITEMNSWKGKLQNQTAVANWIGDRKLLPFQLAAVAMSPLCLTDMVPPLDEQFRDLVYIVNSIDDRNSVAHRKRKLLNNTSLAQSWFTFAKGGSHAYWVLIYLHNNTEPSCLDHDSHKIIVSRFLFGADWSMVLVIVSVHDIFCPDHSNTMVNHSVNSS